MINKQRGQSVVEYSILIMLVVISIVIGGPFLRRSVQAFLRAQSQAVKDADRENIRQSGNIPPTPPCTCSGWTDGGCGAGICDETQRYSSRICTPLACEREYACTNDASCCTTGYKFVDCGSLVDYSAYEYLECPWRAGIDPQLSAAASAVGQASWGTCMTAQGADTLLCAIGEARITLRCGSESGSTMVYGCVDQPACRPACWNIKDETSEPSPGSQACPASEEYSRGMILTQEVAYRKHGGAPSNTDMPTRELKLFKYESTDLSPQYNGDVALRGAWQVPWAYVDSEEDCTHGPTYWPRGCTRFCSNGYVPGVTADTCEPPSCDTNRVRTNTSYRGTAPASATSPLSATGIVEKTEELSAPLGATLPVKGGTAINYKSPLIRVPSVFTFDVWAEDLNYYVACFNASGEIVEEYYSNPKPVEFFECPSANAIEINDHKYCYRDISGAVYVDTDDLINHNVDNASCGCLNCDNPATATYSANQVFIRVFEGGMKGSSALGARVRYNEFRPLTDP